MVQIGIIGIEIVWDKMKGKENLARAWLGMRVRKEKRKIVYKRRKRRSQRVIQKKKKWGK